MERRKHSEKVAYLGELLFLFFTSSSSPVNSGSFFFLACVLVNIREKSFKRTCINVCKVQPLFT